MTDKLDKIFKTTIRDFVKSKNDQKFIFTAGPSSLLKENITGLTPCFGRGDPDYLNIEKEVMENIKKISGHNNIVRLQGSASVALEIIIHNFLRGKILLIDTGYYSDRLKSMLNNYMRADNNIVSIDVLDWKEISSFSGSYDWVVACYTETSCGIKLPIEELRLLSDRVSSKLFLDATASIGLEDNHEYADIIGFSSCKGLFGLTGASFIAYHDIPDRNEVFSFYLNIDTHINKLVTGPYHTITSLHHILSNYSYFKESVLINKKRFYQRMANYSDIPISLQPNLCTYVSCNIEPKDSRVILYKPRNNLAGNIVCHLGEAHLGSKADGSIQDQLRFIE